ncbi:MAG: FAD-dependent oxidoreductase [Treponema sp.]|nr:FAD-dependent oxidoreductase [Treponema sp.]
MGGLHAPGGGIIEPYRFVFALVESAQKNGIDPHTNFKAKEAAWQDGRAVHARYAVNAAGLFAGEGFTIKPRKADFSTTRERLERMLESGKTMILFLSRGDVITSFAGLRPALLPHRPLAGM